MCLYKTEFIIKLQITIFVNTKPLWLISIKYTYNKCYEAFERRNLAVPYVDLPIFELYSFV